MQRTYLDSRLNRTAQRSVVDTGRRRTICLGGAVRTVRLAVIIGGLATPVLLAAVSLTTGLSIGGWIVGLAVGWTATALLAYGRVRSDEPAIQPADWITLVRALLTAGVAALVADSFVRPAHVTALVVVASVAIALDAVDGQVARRTGTD